MEPNRRNWLKFGAASVVAAAWPVVRISAQSAQSCAPTVPQDRSPSNGGSWPEVFDTIVRVCNDNGFSPRLHHELNNMNSVLATVEAGEGVAIVTATASNLRADNVSFFRLEPDEVRIDFVAAWPKKEPSVVLQSFLELLDEELPSIRKIMKFA